MPKYNPSPDPSKELIVRPVRFEKRAIEEALDIHNNFSEFVRDALDEKITKEQANLKAAGIK